ncbi:hypothetical protein SAMN03080598_02870 [Algoriphagus boritolerans DSM 17298 = JCM 18970]|uniref:Uncharacterized protein n=1 Tax=Algoriphagus boritolerans DSM 17298 = JCM 18970 TaxID=1120964 RepID=A0A1H5Y8W1_9BACT|nr:hypothetical protein SAMN03080598_02870 [Algoriphagus boritolerans DSM 17298 = JCM 18970]
MAFGIGTNLAGAIVKFQQRVFVKLDFRRTSMFGLKIPVFDVEKMKMGRKTAQFKNYLPAPAIIFGKSSILYFRGLLVSISITFISVTVPFLSVKIISKKLPFGAFENMELY